ncbi:putative ribonuclease H1/H2 small subunit [Trypanosoma cruzi]|uniref:Uncharacterized protein n=1 Tax=Trypanosoma cruzi TaxID=5693 RepID=A0A2V2VBY9_TRYCR|nr:hypothetical protein BCY84_19448 [Trypanosoma cruzi cruzi]PWU88435.1 hypothetical protein C4B63_73g5 [Trypanosoma cruzi]PWU91823.1 hypothetical protein C4B63_41g255 [Trypanosoma cruzi]RNF22396.1 putative ribonuclease H1/H2 small subunit [Trypanosoma cruzi]
MVAEEARQERDACVVHSLPFKTTFRGTTDIEENFSRHIEHTENGGLRNTLRGRTLIGREVVLPPSYVLAVTSFMPRQQYPLGTGAAGCVTSSAPSLAQVEAVASDVRITATEDRFCVWEHDKQPERVDALAHWLELSRALHSAP